MSCVPGHAHIRAGRKQDCWHVLSIVILALIWKVWMLFQLEIVGLNSGRVLKRAF